MSIVQTLCHKYSIPIDVTENTGMGATLKKDEQWRPRLCIAISRHNFEFSCY